MTTLIAPQPRFRAFDSSGSPLSGGKLYTYAAGTTTPKDTFIDSTGNTANTNPVLLDADGYADVWLEGGDYKFILKNASDVDVWGAAVDNIVGNREYLSASDLGISNVTATGSTEARTLNDRFSDALSPLDFGAAGDGVTDDVTALNAILSGGDKIVDGLGKTYRVDSQLTMEANTRLQNIKLDFSNAGDITCIVGSGSLDTAITLTADVAAGDVVLPLTSLGSIVVDDWLFLTSDTIFEAANNSTLGEWVRVKSIATLDVTLYAPVRYTYTTADNAQIEKANFLEGIIWDNVEIIGSGSAGNQFGFNFTYGYFPKIINSKIKGTDNRAGQFTTCLGYMVNNCTMGDSKEAGLEYGISPASTTSYGVVSNCFFYNIKHAVASGGVNGICRGNIAIGNRIYGSAGGLDAHPASEDTQFIDNYIESDGQTANRDSININGLSATVRGNVIRGSERYGILFSPVHANHVGSCDISHNDVETISGSSGGILVQSIEGCVVKGAKVESNIVNGLTTNGIVFSCKTNAASKFLDTIVSNNAVGGRTSPTRAFYFEALSGTEVENVNVSGNIFNAVASAETMRMVNSTSTFEKVLFTGNNVKAQGAGNGVEIVGINNALSTANIVDCVGAGTHFSLTGTNNTETGNLKL